jgi:hypothetical protein
VSQRGVHRGVFCFLATILFSPPTQAQAPAGVPVAQIAPAPDSKITFNVKASVAIDGTFDKWDANLTFASTDPTTGVLDMKVEADSVNTGSGMKNDKLKSKDFFDAKNDRYITFHSDKPLGSRLSTNMRIDWRTYISYARRTLWTLTWCSSTLQTRLMWRCRALSNSGGARFG